MNRRNNVQQDDCEDTATEKRRRKCFFRRKRSNEHSANGTLLGQRCWDSAVGGMSFVVMDPQISKSFIRKGKK